MNEIQELKKEVATLTEVVALLLGGDRFFEIERPEGVVTVLTCCTGPRGQHRENCVLEKARERFTDE